MAKVQPIRELNGCHFKGVSLEATSRSTWDAECKLAYLERQKELARVTGYYFPHLRTALYVILVETNLQCDALSRVRGYTGIGTPFFKT